MSLVPESFELLARDTQDGRPVVYVGRWKLYGAQRVLTVIKLVKRPNGHWYNYGQWISKGRFRVTDDPRSDRTRPLRLSDSKLDTTLKAYAEQG